MADLAKQFVCVRIQSMNGVNLDNFQFEYDLTWMSFFQDATGKTYTRYGGRDDSGSESHLSQPSLVHTMRSVLELHQQNATQETSRYEPFAKTTTLPSDLPQMKEMIGGRKETCIHCHDVKVAKLRHLHDVGKLTKDMVFTYPSPSRLGIILDHTQQNIVNIVAENSTAADAGLQAGDKLLSTDGLRILTYADLTRALELSPPIGNLPLKIERNGVEKDLTVDLPAGWRISDDPSWRASLHTVGPSAGFWGQPANLDERQQLGLKPTDLALKITFIWAPHAKAAKVRIGDVVVDLDGNRKNMNMRQCHGFLNMNRDWGDEITLTVMRRRKPVELQMTLPSQPLRE